VAVGCGVTAWTNDDALWLLQHHVFGGRSDFEVLSVVEDIDISTLDCGHVLPNMGTPSDRGIWFPLGYLGPYRNRD
jgi:hypothetical protein